MATLLGHLSLTWLGLDVVQELHCHLEECLSRNLRARCSPLISNVLDTIHTELTGNMNRCRACGTTWLHVLMSLQCSRVVCLLTLLLRFDYSIDVALDALLKQCGAYFLTFRASG